MASMNAVWEKKTGPDGKSHYIRPMIGSEHILDQVHELQHGHDQFAFGVTFSGQLRGSELESRLFRALIRLRYTSPLLSAAPTRGIHDPEFRSWVYTPVNNIQEAEAWARSILRLNDTVAQSNPEIELCKIVERRLDDKKVFEVHLTGPYVDGEYTLFVYSSHAFVEGQAMIALIRQLLEWMAAKDLKVEDELQPEDIQVQNLDPGAVLQYGGLPKTWKEVSPAFFKKLAEPLTGKKPSHSLRPQRTEITKIGKIIRAHRSLDQQTTSRLLQGVKSHGLTVTQVLEAAHAVAAYTLEPLPPTEMANSHITVWPTLVSTRHFRVPPYNRPDLFGNLNSGFALHFPPELVNFPPETDLKTRVLTLARSSQAQYREFLSFPYHMFTFPAEAEATPLRGPLGDDPNKYSGEITGLGVLDSKIGLEWQEEGETKPAIVVRDAHLGLRQCNKRTMVHFWTIRGSFRLQVQASDIWDAEYLERFLDEIIKGALSVCVPDED
ncbi:hypothetical protein RhiJN_17043 [Ceratobasidium sp. AG-Ba]|nr:hypothetical protein RhiJN_17043 [Ceratobasidium sp. AG-Ba]